MNNLKNGNSFDSLLHRRTEFKEQPNPIDVYFGDLQENIEDTLYLLEKNQYTGILSASDGWYIFFVYDKTERRFETESEREEAIKSVKKILSERIGERIQGQFYRDFFSDKKVDVNSKLFLGLADNLKQIFNYKESIRQKNATTLLTLDAYDVFQLRKNLGDSNLQTVFVQFDNNPVTLDKFINEMIFDGFQIEKSSIPQIQSELNTRVRIFIERELLAREGYRRNLQFDPEVQYYVSMWRDYFLSQSFLSSQIEKENITDSAALEYYEQRYDSVRTSDLVNVIEILVDSLSKAEKLYARALNGEDFKQLANKYSMRSWTKNTDGEFGLFPVTMMQEIGSTAATMKIGEISAPIKVKEGYSIIKLTDRQKARTEVPSKTFEEVKNSLKREIAYENKFEAIIDTTANLANSNFIEINPVALNNIEITNLNSFAIRIMGFGGKITAVPLSKPFTDWIYKWKSKPNILP
jgi:parvulin-like peptidyl-prolyl isomerase